MEPDVFMNLEEQAVEENDRTLDFAKKYPNLDRELPLLPYYCPP